MTEIKHFHRDEWNELFNDLKARLLEIEKGDYGTVRAIERCISTVEDAIAVLTYRVRDHVFDSKDEEVQFYKEVKPTFHGYLLYYRRLFQIEISRPIGGLAIQESYFDKELQKLREFFDDNKFIYQYLRSGLSHLDERFFFRPTNDTVIGLKLYSLHDDPAFPTSFDMLVAKVKANDLLQEYLSRGVEEIKALEKGERSFRPTLMWTESKTALIELAYALQAAGAFNNGKTELREVVDSLQVAFQVDLGNYPRTFQEILSRKTGYTNFIDKLRDKLLLKIKNIEDKHIK